MTLSYREFLASKAQFADAAGFEPLWMPDFLYPFQRFLVDWTVRMGRSSLFCDCGMGKGPMQLVWAENVVRHTNRPVLILAPLAVAQQFKREAEKFDVEAHISADGKPRPNITIANYERLHKFDMNDYSGVACDECFPAGTLVDTPSGQRAIEALEVGDRILNASGVDVVARVHRREVSHAVAVDVAEGTGRQRIVVSPHHPIFTRRGWIGAQDLEPGDAILQTSEAMRMVRGTIPSASVPGVRARAILREILLGEMADEYARASCEGPYARVGGQAREESFGILEVRDSGSECSSREDSEPQSNGRSRSASEDFPSVAGDTPSAFSARRQWDGFDKARENPDRFPGAGMGTDCRPDRDSKGFGIADALQDRLRGRGTEDCHRGGRHFPSGPQGSGRTEGCIPSFARVDRVEVLERGHPELECLRAADGKLYFHDLTATRHPSYSVAGLLVHNSSIIKHWTGATQKSLTRFLSKLQYRLLSTATPAPNDYLEMGVLSEALGGITHTEMLGIFFRQLSDDEKKKRARADDIIFSKRLSWRVIQSMGQWVLKPHAFEPFWKWVASWARACRKPSDLGDFDDSDFILPPLIRRDHEVIPRTAPPGYLFTIPAIGVNQERGERMRTLDERSELVAELTRDSDSAIVWCHLNLEGDRLEKEIDGAVQVKGSQSLEEKEELILAFLDGHARVLVTKPKIAGMGLNLQHCAHVVCFVDHSYEKFYQCIRRCYRFGQKRPVTLDVIATEGEVNVRRNMERKERLASQMFDQVIGHMNDSLGVKSDRLALPAEVPSWLKP